MATIESDLREGPAPITAVDTRQLKPQLFGQVDEALAARLGAMAERAALTPRVWHVNSTAAGGGVAEMLPSLIGCARGLGMDMRWLVISGTAPFFGVTKRLHHALHGSTGDGSALGEEARAIYESALAPATEALLSRVRPGDVVMLHDPQTAGLAAALSAAGHPVVWRCHVGHDAWNDEVEGAWRFLLPYVSAADAWVFSRDSYVPEGIDRARTAIVAPSVDPTSAKNEFLDGELVTAILGQAGLLATGGRERRALRFVGGDGVSRVVSRRAVVLSEDGPPAPDVPLVVQISRWDPLKDFPGVMRGFARMLDDGLAVPPVHLMLAGPQVDGVADDPEALATFEHAVHEWRALPAPVRARISLVQLPTVDIIENASMVNALQRHATVIVQKSLHEGFGLTVTEAMLKARPLLASAVGGIRDQITDGVNGVLLPDPTDMAAFAERLSALLLDPDRAADLGRAARQTVVERFLTPRHLEEYLLLVERARLSAGDERPRASEGMVEWLRGVLPARPRWA